MAVLDEYICMICNEKTYYEDRICMHCHELKPSHIPESQYVRYFKLLTKEKHK